MASWDGSYAVSEDPNYYLYSGQDMPGSNNENWTYFPGNESNGYLQNGHQFYVQNEHVFQQNCSTGFYHVDANAPSVSSNLVSLTNNYHDRGPPNAMESAQMPNNLGYYPSVSNSQDCFTPVQCQNDAYDRSKRNFPKETGSRTYDSSKRSNLHATAHEFVPTTNFDKEGDSKDHSDPVSSIPAQKGPFPRDTNKYDRRHNGKQPVTYNQREGRNRQFSREDTFRSNNKQQHFRQQNKYQGDKYPSNRRYVDKRKDRPPSSTDELGHGFREKDDGDESPSGTKIDGNRNQRSLNNSSEGMSEHRDNNVTHTTAINTYYNSKEKSTHLNRAKRFNNRLKEYVGEPSVSWQPHNYTKSMRKYPSSHRQDRSDREYKGRQYNHQQYNDFGENCNRESRAKEYKERDGSKNAVAENKEREVENWRSKKETNEKSGPPKRTRNKKSTIDDDASQRERLTDQLNRGHLECLVCCEYIKQDNFVWSCINCHHVLHLKCVKKWAKSSHSENGWRCPACQNANLAIPREYYCFCGKTQTPEWNRRDTAHSCGEVCGRPLSKNNCDHKCTLLCHPGSCPLCIAMVSKHCGCGRTSQTVQCSTDTLLLCDSICDKDLQCGHHKCEKKCHHGECGACEKTVLQECYCGKNTREVTCESDVTVVYSCKNVCAKPLNCSNHTCQKMCHSGECEPCAFTPDKITTCYCGRTPLTIERTSCLDPIPVCGKVCGKNLKCGQPSNPHTCKADCHEGQCPDCDLTTDVKCRCGNMDREIACKDLTTKADDARCEKRCTKKRSCGKHKCNQLCCIDIEHVCPLQCSKTLSCGRHKCEQTCHKGWCQSCWRSSFEELYCECGNEVIYPPVPCGTRRPACDRPCSRQHPCGHEVLHNCHSEPTCPPCTVLTHRWCHGKHELRKAVPCHVTEISCGLPCNKPISCGRHKCVTTCHSGPCEKPGQQCSQPCTTPREMCGHICAAQCHEGKCPDTPCKEMVRVTCQCGHRSMSRACAENAREYQRIASNILASKMADMQLGHSIDLEEVFGQGAKKQNQLKTLECNDECKIIERNRRLALGLQIVNPDLSGKLMPRYSDFMKQWAKKDPHFCQMVHEKLTELVQLAKTSKQKSRSYSFESMNRDKRLFVHESCEHFGCESQAYDREPKRNVVATAVKDKCWLPSYSLLEIVQRNNGQRKVPRPTLSTAKTDASVKTVLSLPVRKSQKPATSSDAKVPDSEIDYFDYQG